MERPADLDTFVVTDVLQKINDWNRAAVLAHADRWLAQRGGG